jgi:hypothetical protein
MNFKQVLEEELYLEERKPPQGKKYIALFDIDETLLSPNNIYIHKIANGKDIPLTPEQYALEDVKKEKQNGVVYDYREFRDPKIVENSIFTGKPIWKNVKMLNDHIRNGWEVSILTARGLENIIYKALNKWAMFQKDKGLLERYGKVFVKNLVHAVNDEVKIYEGMTDFEKKANVIKKYAAKYDKVKFIDDDERNLKAVKNLNLSNVIVIKAWEKNE